MKPMILLMLVIAVLPAAAQRAPVKRGLPIAGTYRITEVLDTACRLFKTGDVLDVSLKNGLRHYRNSALINHYKIIPATLRNKRVAPCQVPPCPEFTDEAPVWYMEPLKRYIMVTDLEFKSYFNAAPAGFDARKGVLTDGQRQLWFIMKKVKNPEQKK